jgi:hypothetical protein
MACAMEAVVPVSPTSEVSTDLSPLWYTHVEHRGLEPVKFSFLGEEGLAVGGLGRGQRAASSLLGWSFWEGGSGWRWAVGGWRSCLGGIRFAEGGGRLAASSLSLGGGERADHTFRPLLGPGPPKQQPPPHLSLKEWSPRCRSIIEVERVRAVGLATPRPARSLETARAPCGVVVVWGGGLGWVGLGWGGREGVLGVREGGTRVCATRAARIPFGFFGGGFGVGWGGWVGWVGLGRVGLEGAFWMSGGRVSGAGRPNRARPAHLLEHRVVVPDVAAGHDAVAAAEAWRGGAVGAARNGGPAGALARGSAHCRTCLRGQTGEKNLPHCPQPTGPRCLV